MTDEIKRVYKCQFCDKPFTRKSWYDRHNCDKKKQFASTHNLDNIRALKLFNHWLRRCNFLKRKQRDRSMDEFMRSPYRNLFIKLIVYTNDTYVVTPYKFLNYLTDQNVPERHWFSGGTLGEYRKHISAVDDAMVQARNTFHYVRDYCDDKALPINHFFREVGVGDAIHMVTSMRLSPWVLLGYDASVEQLVERIDRERFYMLDEHIGLQWWLERIEQNAQQRAMVNEFCKEHFGA